MNVAKKTEILDSRKRPTGAYFRDQGRALKEAFLYLATHLGSTYFVWLLIGVSLALPGGLWLIYQNVHERLIDLQGHKGFTVYLEVAATDAQITSIDRYLSADDRVRNTKVTTSSAAMKELLDLISLPSNMTEGRVNLLPASISVSVGQYVGELSIGELREEISALQGVAEVQEDRYWVEHTSLLLEVLSRLNVVGAVLFGLSAILISSSAVRLAINERMEEVRILNLVGSPRSYQRRIFQFCGMLYGIGGGLMTAVLLVLVIIFLERPINEYGSASNIELTLHGFDARFVGFMLLIAAGTGMLGSWISMFQALRKSKLQ